MRLVFAMLALLVMGGPVMARPAAKPDWTRTVTLARDGAYVLGNPRAPNRLAEYVSYTCSHCAAFVGEAHQTLRDDWVRRGVMSIEVRNAVRDAFDLTAALLARCGGPARFFAFHDALFANQDAWMRQIEAFESTRPDSSNEDPAKVLVTIADKTGLSALLAARGLPVATQRACLSDKKALALVTAMANEAWDVRKIGGTPAFLLNGKMVDGAHNWAGLRPALPAPSK
jgi:protein-disulfide isomerase